MILGGFMQYTQIIGSKVFSIYECKNVGYVLGGTFNLKLNKLTNLIVADDDNETTYCLSIRNIYTINNNCVLIKNLTKLVVSDTESQPIINMDIVDITGKTDTVKDITIDENFNLTTIFGANLTFDPKDIVYTKNNILLVNTSSQKISHKNFRPRTKKLTTLITSPAQNVNILQDLTKPTPVRVNNLNTIMGKKLADNLYSRQNEILAYKNTIITQNTINIARQFNVLNNLLILAK